MKELARLMKEVCETVIEEPVLGPVHGPPFRNKKTTVDAGARTDILARGFFEPQIDAHFDVTIVDTCCASALRKQLRPEAVLAKAQRDKRDEYEERVTRTGGSFTPFAASVYGTLAPESERVLLTLTSKLSKTGGPRRTTEACARLRIQMAIMKATSMCIRTRSVHTPSGATVCDVLDKEPCAAVLEEEEEEEGLDLVGEWHDLRAAAC